MNLNTNTQDSQQEPGKKLRLIQCGVGGHGGGWVPVTSNSPDFDLVAIVDIVPGNLEKIGEQTGLPPEHRFTSLEDALEKVEADAVLTVTPPAVHVQHARLAFARGMHLITEKPLADTLENAREMLRRAKESNCQLSVSQNYRYSNHFATLKQQFEARPVGQYGHGHLSFYIPADFTGSFRETMEFPLLVDMAIHHIDMIRAVLGNIARVTAHSFAPPWNWYGHEPGLMMILEMEDGTPFSYTGDWSARGQATSWSGDWRLQCAEGALHFANSGVKISRSQKWMKEETVEEVPIHKLEFDSTKGTLHDFANAIRSGKPAPTSGEDNIYSLATVFAAVASAQQKRTISIAEMLGE
jgi:predicted dehydrogenase